MVPISDGLGVRVSVLIEVSNFLCFAHSRWSFILEGMIPVIIVAGENVPGLDLFLCLYIVSFFLPSLLEIGDPWDHGSIETLASLLIVFSKLESLVIKVLASAVVFLEILGAAVEEVATFEGKLLPTILK